MELKDNQLKYLKDLLEAEGFEVEIWESPIDKIMKLPKEELTRAIGSIYAAKTSNI